jgi:hypothetical protein
VAKKKPVKSSKRKQPLLTAALLMQSQNVYTRAAIRKLGGKYIGGHGRGPLYWFRDCSVACLQHTGLVVVARLR